MMKNLFSSVQDTHGDTHPQKSPFDDFEAMLETLSAYDKDKKIAFDFRAIANGKAPQNIRLNNANDGMELRQKFDHLTALNRHDYNIYVTINQTDGQGVKGGNITHIRAFFLDFDNVNHNRVEIIQKFCDDHHIPQPNLIVESSAGKHHFYWTFYTVPVHDVDFSDCQKRLIHYFRQHFPNDPPDDKIHDLPRIMRLAGFNHMKDANHPFLSRIVYSSEQHDFVEVFNWIKTLAVSNENKSSLAKITPKTPESQFLTNSNNRMNDDDLYQLALSEIKHAPVGQRNNTLHEKAVFCLSLAKEGRITKTIDHIKQDLRHSSTLAGLDMEEINRTIQSALNAHTVQTASPENYQRQRAEYQHQKHLQWQDIQQQNVQQQLAQMPMPEDIPQSGLLPVPDLPFSALPPTLAEYIQDEAKRAENMPPDFLCVSILTTLAIVIGAKVEVRLKQHDNFGHIPNLWGLIVAPPSHKKSFAISIGSRFLTELECQFAKQAQQQQTDNQAHINNLQAKIKQLKKSIDKEQDDEKRKILIEQQLEAENQLEDLQQSYQVRIAVNQATREKLGEIQAHNPNGVVAIYDEVAGLFHEWKKSGKEGDRQYFLAGYNGDSPYRFDTIGRGTVTIQNHCLAILGGIQDSKLIDYLQESIKGKDNDGMLQRFQLMVYPDSHPQFNDSQPNYPAKNALYNIYQAFFNLTPNQLKQLGAQQLEQDKRPFFRLTDDAYQIYKDWQIQLYHKIGNVNEETIIREHLGKYPKLLASLALIFHLIDAIELNCTGKISKRCLENAIILCDYFEQHARRIYGLVLYNKEHKAHILAKKLRHLKPDDRFILQGFTVRDVLKMKSWGGLTEYKDIEQAIGVLVSKHWLFEVVQQGNGRPTERYFINPKLEFKN